MPLDSLEFRTSLQKLLVGLILILVPLTVFGFYVAMQGDSHIRQASGENFRSLTLTAAESTSEFIARCVRDVSLIANAPGPVQAVSAANRQYERQSEEAVRSKIDAIDQTWESSQTDGLSAKILTSDLAHQLRRARELDPTLLKITVADVNGAIVAATDRPAHYSQTDQQFWRVLSSGASGAINVSDLRYDDQSRLYYISVAYPILQEGTGRFIDAVTATVDSTTGPPKTSPRPRTIRRQSEIRHGRGRPREAGSPAKSQPSGSCPTRSTFGWPPPSTAWRSTAPVRRSRLVNSTIHRQDGEKPQNFWTRLAKPPLETPPRPSCEYRPSSNARQPTRQRPILQVVPPVVPDVAVGSAAKGVSPLLRARRECRHFRFCV